MDILAHTMVWIIAGLIALHFALLLPYVRFLHGFRRAKLSDRECPRAAVILCVRGLDPYFPLCLRGLFAQDYPDYEVWIIVDSVRDPAWPVVNKLARQLGRGNVRVVTLSERLATSSRKAAGVLQVLSRLDGAVEVAATIDSDAVPHSSWLRELVAPLSDPRVAVASGNRWYMPEKPTIGSLVRYLWNAAAVVQMYWFEFGWGGSLAYKMDFVRQSDLRRRLANAFTDDITTCRCAQDHGYRVAFAPSVIVVNREDCTLKGLFGFLQRQMLCVRLHNPRWRFLVGHGVAMTTVLGLSCLAEGIAAATANWPALASIAAALAAYWGSLLLMTLPLEWCVRRIVRQRREPIAGLGLWGWLGATLAVPLAQIVHFGAMFAALFARTHLWRGVRYRFYSPAPVRVIEDAAEAA